MIKCVSEQWRYMHLGVGYTGFLRLIGVRVIFSSTARVLWCIIFKICCVALSIELTVGNHEASVVALYFVIHRISFMT